MNKPSDGFSHLIQHGERGQIGTKTDISGLLIRCGFTGCAPSASWAAREASAQCVRVCRSSAGVAAECAAAGLSALLFIRPLPCGASDACVETVHDLDPCASRDCDAVLT
jgi:hypothetical protein